LHGLDSDASRYRSFAHDLPGRAAIFNPVRLRMHKAAVSELTVEQLQSLANEPAKTFARIESILHALSGSEEQAQWANEALENCGKPPSDVLTVIAPLTRHPSELVASWACKLLARAGCEAHWTEPFLVEALAAQKDDAAGEGVIAVDAQQSDFTREDTSQDIVREEAARALGQIGATSIAAREALAAAARHGSPRLKRLAIASLGG
jgi:hypothetical protein